MISNEVTRVTNPVTGTSLPVRSVDPVLRHDLLRHENAYRQYQRRRRIFGALVGAAELLLAFMLLMEQVGSRDLPFFSQITAWVMSLF